MSGVTKELGFTILVCDICNWVGDEKPDRHPALNQFTKKVGLSAYPLADESQIVSLYYMDDYANQMI